MSIRFDESDVREMGRAARGVKGITLGKDDKVVGMEVISKDGDETLLIVTANDLPVATDPVLLLTAVPLVSVPELGLMLGLFAVTAIVPYSPRMIRAPPARMRNR